MTLMTSSAKVTAGETASVGTLSPKTTQLPTSNIRLSLREINLKTEYLIGFEAPQETPSTLWGKIVSKVKELGSIFKSREVALSRSLDTWTDSIEKHTSQKSSYEINRRKASLSTHGKLTPGDHSFKAKNQYLELEANFKGGHGSIVVTDKRTKTRTILETGTRDEFRSVILHGELSRMTRDIGRGARTDNPLAAIKSLLMDELGVGYNMKSQS